MVDPNFTPTPVSTGTNQPRVRSRDIPKDQRRKAASGGSGSVTRSPEEIKAKAVKDDAPLIGWTVAYFANASDRANYVSATVLSVMNDSVHLKTADGRYVPNVLFSGNKRLVDKPKLARSGVWDWAAGFEKERMTESAVLAGLIEKVGALEAVVKELSDRKPVTAEIPEAFKAELEAVLDKIGKKLTAHDQQFADLAKPAENVSRETPKATTRPAKEKPETSPAAEPEAK